MVKRKVANGDDEPTPRAKKATKSKGQGSASSVLVLASGDDRKSRVEDERPRVPNPWPPSDVMQLLVFACVYPTLKAVFELIKVWVDNHKAHKLKIKIENGNNEMEIQGGMSVRAIQKRFDEFRRLTRELSEDDINSVIEVNLEAPMQLTRMVIPKMLERGAGHIVNMSSLAGKAGPAYQEPYAATKAGLIEFTMSLRETYFRSGVSASVICPGFVEAGIYARLKEKSGCSAPVLLGTSRPETVGKAIVRAIQKDIPQIIINPYPVRPIFALTQISPRLGSWLARSLGANEFFKRVYETQK